MAHVFISFLGIGNFNKTPGYDQAEYAWTEKTPQTMTCCFAQTAILAGLEASENQNDTVDRAVLFCTRESHEKHLDALKDEFKRHLKQMPEIIIPDLVPTDMTADNQWAWFEQLLDNVGFGDRLIMDFTHGMRAVPIIFSSAVGFLTRAKHITLDHALYAWYDRERKDAPHPIVDMKDFYVINDWAESVARLTDDADARKLGDMAKQSQVDALAPLADEHLIAAFQEMTDCIRNVDVNNVSQKVNDALAYVQQSRTRVGGSARLMLDLVWEKFCTLATDYPPSGRYDQPYFETQIKIIEVLMEHRLFMQAFTAMREMVGSIGMVGLTGKYGNKEIASNKGRRYRRFADIFIRMVSIAETPEGNKKGWKFVGQDAKDKDTLYPWFLELKDAEIEQKLRCIVKEIVDIRNGFDHAWTSRTGALEEIEEKGKEYLTVLHDIVSQMAEQNLFS
ncbi:TIGR02221 family CRISPR-associated protein [Desulfobacter latus]|uniref:TIGR02221 family CRISPR-associated protein n=1 Tax=Desulfobacter latus TaxID=2292 RepID=A0A850TDS3_9BACT|nr:TIGR02221 family CRISPR-associated protein [Desulfobacter latus]NWH06437.1 TIGR02221 family CRISPR-associated protein [Desulfobacter latus]